jgi:hypothetical protein
MAAVLILSAAVWGVVGAQDATPTAPEAETNAAQDATPAAPEADDAQAHPFLGVMLEEG